MIWLQFIMALLQAVQLVAVLILPLLAALLGLVGLGLFFWLLTGFVAELHGFRSPMQVFAGRADRAPRCRLRRWCSSSA